MKVRLARQEEWQQAADWMIANLKLNDADPDSLIGCTFLAVEDEQGPVYYIPVKPALMLESLAVDPAANNKRRVRALAAFQEVVSRVKDAEVIYMTRGGTRLDQLAEKAGYEELPFKVMRLKK